VGQQYQDRWSFQKGDSGAYRFCYKQGLLDLLFGPLETKTWCHKSVEEVVKTCKHRYDLRVLHPGAHKYAVRHDMLDQLFGETKNTPLSDNNVLYIWSVCGHPDLYKVGVTSERLKKSRIKYTCKKSGLKASQIWLFYLKDARSLETEFLAMGKPHPFDKPFTGHTEFRIFTKPEIDYCLAVAQRQQDEEDGQ